MQRPFTNGSSGTTMEVLVLLTLFGASALTLLALRPGKRREDEADDAPPDERGKDER